MATEENIKPIQYRREGVAIDLALCEQTRCGAMQI